MGYGSWSSTAYTSYSCSRGRNTTTALDGTVTLTSNYTAQDIPIHPYPEYLDGYDHSILRRGGLFFRTAPGAAPAHSHNCRTQSPLGGPAADSRRR